MITAVNLTAAGSAKFEAWFASVAAPSVLCGAAEEEMCQLIAERLIAAETLVYELGKLFTRTERPESITFNLADLNIRELVGEAGDDLAELSRKELIARCKAMVAAGQRIEAVKTFRVATGASLTETHRILNQ